MINLQINGVSQQVEPGRSVLDVAKDTGVHIPTLCHHKDLCIAGNCRVCLVEVNSHRKLQAACALPVAEGMDIRTNSAAVRSARQNVIELLLSEHRCDCLKCVRNGNCELQKLANEYQVEDRTYMDLSKGKCLDQSSPSIVKDDSKCIRCQRCVRTCTELQKVSALTVAHKGREMQISTFMGQPLGDVLCSNCGQCINRCPTGALIEVSSIAAVWAAIDDPDKHVVVQTAPAVRISIGEELGQAAGTRVTGKMVHALRRLGFDKVFDTDFSADLTIMEEGHELLARLKGALVHKDPAAVLPLFTSCSPGWVKYLEHQFPELLNHLSSCKSPQQMFGAVAKTWYAKKTQRDPRDIVVVSVMPCTAKKFEARRPEMRNADGLPDVDHVLTTRELARMIRQAGLDFSKLEECSYDSLLGSSTGAGIIFGATGGVMEAALRTAYEIITGREVPFRNLDIIPVRGMEGIREAGILLENCQPEWSFLEGIELKIAVAHGLRNAHKLLEGLKEGRLNYHFVEIMACPGGCLGGGGQPIPTDMEIRRKRMQAIYAEDSSMPLRKSHENPEVQQLYKEMLLCPLGEESHKLLHTSYTVR